MLSTAYTGCPGSEPKTTVWRTAAPLSLQEDPLGLGVPAVSDHGIVLLVLVLVLPASLGGLGPAMLGQLSAKAPGLAVPPASRESRARRAARGASGRSRRGGAPAQGEWSRSRSRLRQRVSPSLAVTVRLLPPAVAGGGGGEEAEKARFEQEGRENEDMAQNSGL